MKETTIVKRIDYTKIDSYNIKKTSYKFIENPTTKPYIYIDKLKVMVDISYTCSYLDNFVEKGMKTFVVYDGLETPDTMWLQNIDTKLSDFRLSIKRELAGWPE